MNKIDRVFKNHKRPVLSIYTTAGFPEIDSLYTLLPALEKAGVDLVEVGIPFSDPMADGIVIQQSSHKALQNGMSLSLLFKQLEEIKPDIPIILMGYFNPVFQYGIDSFLSDCQKCGVSGTILPDLPPAIFENYRSRFEANSLANIFLVTPQTAPDRIRKLAKETSGFLYAVSTASVTGNKEFGEANNSYLKNLKSQAGNTPVMIGFGIKTRDDLKKVSEYADGGIIGSQFIRHIENDYSTTGQLSPESIAEFVSEVNI